MSAESPGGVSIPLIKGSCSAVIETLRETQKASPDRKCFRMIGGVLVERSVKEVLPALETNLAGVSGNEKEW